MVKSLYTLRQWWHNKAKSIVIVSGGYNQLLKSVNGQYVASIQLTVKMLPCHKDPIQCL